VAVVTAVAVFATHGRSWFSAAAQPTGRLAQPPVPAAAPPTPPVQPPGQVVDPRPPLATLVVASNARGAIVSLDDGSDRPSPSRYEGIEPSVKHRVRISAPAYEPVVRELEARPGETLNLEIVLQKRPSKPAPRPAPKHHPAQAPINPDQPMNPWSN
jgi:hypothetical protein